MAKIRFKCGCGKTLAVDEKYAGKTAKCPACQRPIAVPELPSAAGVKSAPASKSAMDDIYGSILLKQAQQKRVKAALKEYNRKTRKRNLIIAVSVVSVLVVGFLGRELFRTYGPDVGPAKDYPKAVRPYLAGLNRSDVLIRAAAAWEVADAGGRDGAALIGAATKEDEPLVRIIAIRALCHADRAEAPQYLRPLLKDDDLDVRMTAAFALALCTNGEITPESVNPFVKEALTGDASWLAWFENAAKESAPKPKARGFLNTKLGSNNQKTRAEAAWMTAATFGPSPMILPLLRDADQSVAVTACRALAPFLTADAFEQLDTDENPAGSFRLRLNMLTNLSLRLRHEDPVIRREAALALAANGQDRSAYLFAHALTDEDWFVRFAAFKGLLRLDPKKAWEVLRSSGAPGARDDNEWARRVAERMGRSTEEPGS